LRVVHFLSLAIVVSRLTPPDWHGPMRPLLTAMIRCGENSLAMYCLGVLLSFIGYVILVEFSAGIAMQAAVSIAGITLMIAATTLLTSAAKLDRRGPELF
jgi:drug/metabolite transporter (DMT)-like permease